MNDDDTNVFAKIRADHFDRADVPAETVSRVRDAVLASVRRRRRNRRAYVVALVAASYAAGVATILPLLRNAASPHATHVVESGPQNEPDAPKLEPEESVNDLVQDTEAFARRLAQAAPDEKIDLLRAAGDTYLMEQNDITTAARLYSRMLVLCSEQNRIQTNSNDTWLLASLRLAQLKETGNGNSGI
jgi:hypothetical protein